jgi:hypothetical protein
MLGAESSHPHGSHGAWLKPINDVRNRWVSSFMTKIVSIISILLLGAVLVARGQQPADDVISDADKTGIIESVLNLESRNQSSVPDFVHIQTVSSENIEFVEPSRLSAPGFRIVSVGSLILAKQDNVIDYLRFKKISFRHGVAVVELSRVTAGRPCFAPPFSSERRYLYEVRPSPVGWIAKLIVQPAAPSLFARKRPALLR